MKPYANLLAYRAGCTERSAWKKALDACRERAEAANRQRTARPANDRGTRQAEGGMRDSVGIIQNCDRPQRAIVRGDHHAIARVLRP